MYSALLQHVGWIWKQAIVQTTHVQCFATACWLDLEASYSVVHTCTVPCYSMLAGFGSKLQCSPHMYSALLQHVGWIWKQAIVQSTHVQCLATACWLDLEASQSVVHTCTVLYCSMLARFGSKLQCSPHMYSTLLQHVGWIWKQVRVQSTHVQCFIVACWLDLEASYSVVHICTVPCYSMLAGFGSKLQCSPHMYSALLQHVGWIWKQAIVQSTYVQCFATACCLDLEASYSVVHICTVPCYSMLAGFGSKLQCSPHMYSALLQHVGWIWKQAIVQSTYVQYLATDVGWIWKQAIVQTTYVQYLATACWLDLEASYSIVHICTVLCYSMLAGFGSKLQYRPHMYSTLLQHVGWIWKQAIVQSTHVQYLATACWLDLEASYSIVHICTVLCYSMLAGFGSKLECRPHMYNALLQHGGWIWKQAIVQTTYVQYLATACWLDLEASYSVDHTCTVLCYSMLAGFGSKLQYSPHMYSTLLQHVGWIWKQAIVQSTYVQCFATACWLDLEASYSVDHTCTVPCYSMLAGFGSKLQCSPHMYSALLQHVGWIWKQAIVQTTYVQCLATACWLDLEASYSVVHICTVLCYSMVAGFGSKLQCRPHMYSALLQHVGWIWKQAIVQSTYVQCFATACWLDLEASYSVVHICTVPCYSMLAGFGSKLQCSPHMYSALLQYVGWIWKQAIVQTTHVQCFIVAWWLDLEASYSVVHTCTVLCYSMLAGFGSKLQCRPHMYSALLQHVGWIWKQAIVQTTHVQCLATACWLDLEASYSVVHTCTEPCYSMLAGFGSKLQCRPHMYSALLQHVGWIWKQAIVQSTYVQYLATVCWLDLEASYSVDHICTVLYCSMLAGFGSKLQCSPHMYSALLQHVGWIWKQARVQSTHVQCFIVACWLDLEASYSVVHICTVPCYSMLAGFGSKLECSPHMYSALLQHVGQIWKQAIVQFTYVQYLATACWLDLEASYSVVHTCTVLCYSMLAGFGSKLQCSPHMYSALLQHVGWIWKQAIVQSTYVQYLATACWLDLEASYSVVHTCTVLCYSMLAGFGSKLQCSPHMYSTLLQHVGWIWKQAIVQTTHVQCFATACWLDLEASYSVDHICTVLCYSMLAGFGSKLQCRPHMYSALLQHVGWIWKQAIVQSTYVQCFATACWLDLEASYSVVHICTVLCYSMLAGFGSKLQCRPHMYSALLQHVGWIWKQAIVQTTHVQCFATACWLDLEASYSVVHICTVPCYSMLAGFGSKLQCRPHMYSALLQHVGWIWKQAIVQTTHVQCLATACWLDGSKLQCRPHMYSALLQHVGWIWKQAIVQSTYVQCFATACWLDLEASYSVVHTCTVLCYSMLAGFGSKLQCSPHMYSALLQHVCWIWKQAIVQSTYVQCLATACWLDLEASYSVVHTCTVLCYSMLAGFGSKLQCSPHMYSALLQHVGWIWKQAIVQTTYVQCLATACWLDLEASYSVDHICTVLCYSMLAGFGSKLQCSPHMYSTLLQHVGWMEASYSVDHMYSTLLQHVGWILKQAIVQSTHVQYLATACWLDLEASYSVVHTCTVPCYSMLAGFGSKLQCSPHMYSALLQHVGWIWKQAIVQSTHVQCFATACWLDLEASYSVVHICTVLCYSMLAGFGSKLQCSPHMYSALLQHVGWMEASYSVVHTCTVLCYSMLAGFGSKLQCSPHMYSTLLQHVGWIWKQTIVQTTYVQCFATACWLDLEASYSVVHTCTVLCYSMLAGFGSKLQCSPHMYSALLQHVGWIWKQAIVQSTHVQYLATACWLDLEASYSVVHTCTVPCYSMLAGFGSKLQCSPHMYSALLQYVGWIWKQAIVQSTHVQYLATACWLDFEASYSVVHTCTVPCYSMLAGFGSKLQCSPHMYSALLQHVGWIWKQAIVQSTHVQCFATACWLDLEASYSVVHICTVPCYSMLAGFGSKLQCRPHMYSTLLQHVGWIWKQAIVQTTYVQCFVTACWLDLEANYSVVHISTVPCYSMLAGFGSKLQCRPHMYSALLQHVGWIWKQPIVQSTHVQYLATACWLDGSKLQCRPHMYSALLQHVGWIWKQAIVQSTYVQYLATACWLDLEASYSVDHMYSALLQHALLDLEASYSVVHTCTVLCYSMLAGWKQAIVQSTHVQCFATAWWLDLEASYSVDHTCTVLCYSMLAGFGSKLQCSPHMYSALLQHGGWMEASYSVVHTCTVLCYSMLAGFGSKLQCRPHMYSTLLRHVGWIWKQAIVQSTHVQCFATACWLDGSKLQCSPHMYSALLQHVGWIWKQAIVQSTHVQCLATACWLDLEASYSVDHICTVLCYSMLAGFGSKLQCSPHMYSALLQHVGWIWKQAIVQSTYVQCLATACWLDLEASYSVVHTCTVLCYSMVAGFGSKLQCRPHMYSALLQYVGQIWKQAIVQSTHVQYLATACWLDGSKLQCRPHVQYFATACWLDFEASYSVVHTCTVPCYSMLAGWKQAIVQTTYVQCFATACCLDLEASYSVVHICTVPCYSMLAGFGSKLQCRPHVQYFATACWLDLEASYSVVHTCTVPCYSMLAGWKQAIVQTTYVQCFIVACLLDLEASYSVDHTCTVPCYSMLAGFGSKLQCRPHVQYFATACWLDLEASYSVVHTCTVPCYSMLAGWKQAIVQTTYVQCFIVACLLDLEASYSVDHTCTVPCYSMLAGFGSKLQCRPHVQYFATACWLDGSKLQCRPHMYSALLQHVCWIWKQAIVQTTYVQCLATACWLDLEASYSVVHTCTVPCYSMLAGWKQAIVQTTYVQCFIVACLLDLEASYSVDHTCTVLCYSMLAGFGSKLQCSPHMYSTLLQHVGWMEASYSVDHICTVLYCSMFAGFGSKQGSQTMLYSFMLNYNVQKQQSK